MKTENPLTHLTSSYRTALLQALMVFCITLIAQLTVGNVSAGCASSVSAAAGIATGLLAWRLTRRHQRRIDRLTRISEAWLRGNLALRATETRQHELTALTKKLNLLVEHLEEDEQDLDRLGESNIRLTDQVRALAVVEERNRLARELHDSVKQHLFSLAMTASGVRTRLELQDSAGQTPDADLMEMVREIESAAQTAQQETTRLIEDLRPAPLQERGLMAALNDYTLIFGARQHLLIYLDVKCDDQLLPPIITEALYRVAQEALHNVARHARATRVDIELSCTSERVMLRIEDNGVGFDTRRTRKGLGISSMQERLMAVGGRLTVESQPRTGTTIEAEVEVMSRAAAHRSAAPLLPGKDAGESLASLSVATHLGTAGHNHETTSKAEQHPMRPGPESWAWLGERLVIPVGQVWPWLPVEQDKYLSGPVLASGNLELKRERRLLGLRTTYALLANGSNPETLVRLVPERGGYHWDMSGAEWTLRRMQGLKGRAVLERKGQALAAMQYRGRQMDTWTEILFHDRVYRLIYGENAADDFILLCDGDVPALTTMQSSGEANTERRQHAIVTLHTRLPLPLVAIATARIVDEMAVKQMTEAT